LIANTVQIVKKYVNRHGARKNSTTLISLIEENLSGVDVLWGWRLCRWCDS